MDLSKIDKNFTVKTSIEKEDTKFYNIDEVPFKIHGIFKEDGKYRRMPESVAEKVNASVHALHAKTTGGRVRFKTNSQYIAIHAEMENLIKRPHCPFTSSLGFDIYCDNNYIKTFVPPVEIEDGYESVVDFENNELREVTINFPLHSDVTNLYIGVQETAVITETSPYLNTKPIVYYGSSITHGGCASRPGMSYQNILSRRFNYNYVNLVFQAVLMQKIRLLNM